MLHQLYMLFWMKIQVYFIELAIDVEFLWKTLWMIERRISGFLGGSDAVNGLRTQRLVRVLPDRLRFVERTIAIC